jgi:hypothetical protein
MLNMLLTKRSKRDNNLGTRSKLAERSIRSLADARLSQNANYIQQR